MYVKFMQNKPYQSSVKQTDWDSKIHRWFLADSSLSDLLRQSQSISEAFSLLLVRDLFSARIPLTSQICFVPSCIKEVDKA